MVDDVGFVSDFGVDEKVFCECSGDAVGGCWDKCELRSVVWGLEGENIPIMPQRTVFGFDMMVVVDPGRNDVVISAAYVSREEVEDCPISVKDGKF